MKTLLPNHALLGVLIVFILLLTSCTSYKALTTEEARLELRPGNNIRVTTLAGEEMAFEVTSLTDDEVMGEGLAVRLDELKTIERRKVDWIRTVLGGYLVVGLVAVVSGDIGMDFDGLSPGS